MGAFHGKGLKHDNIKYQTLAQAFSDNETSRKCTLELLKAVGYQKKMFPIMHNLKVHLLQGKKNH